MRKDVDATLEEWKSNPLDEAVFLELARRLRGAGDERRLAEVLEVRAAVVDGAERVRLLLSLAHLAGERGDGVAERRSWESFAEAVVDGEDVPAELSRMISGDALPAAARLALARVRLRSGSDAVRVRAASELLSLLPSGSEEALQAWAHLLLVPARAGEARDALLQAMETGRHALGEEAEARIEEWAEANGDHALLAALLAQRAIPSAEDRARLAHLRALLGSPPEAVIAELRTAHGAGLPIASLDRVIAQLRSIWPAPPAELLRFETEVATESGDLGRRAAALLREAEILEGPERGLRLLSAARALRDAKAPAEEIVAAAYEAGHADQSAFDAAVELLRTLGNKWEGRARDVALGMLERLCLETRNHEPWRACLQDQLSSLEGAARAELLARLLDLERRVLGDAAAAATTLARQQDLSALLLSSDALRVEALALRGEVSGDVLDALRGVLRELQEHERLARLLLEGCASSERERAVDSSLELARLHRDTLGTPQEAERILLEVDQRWSDDARVHALRLELAEERRADPASLALALDLSERAQEEVLRTRALRLAFEILASAEETLLRAIELGLESSALEAPLDALLRDERRQAAIGAAMHPESELSDEVRVQLAKRLVATQGVDSASSRPAALLLLQAGALTEAQRSALEVLLEREGSWDALLLLRTQAHEADPGVERTLALAEALDRTGRREQALDVLDAALERAPKESALDAALRERARALGDWSRLSARLEEGAGDTSRTTSERLADMDALAALFAGELGREDLALSWRIEALSLRPDPALLAELRERVCDGASPERLRQALENSLQSTEDQGADVRAELAYEAAALHLDRSGDASRGRELLRLALSGAAPLASLAGARLLHAPELLDEETLEGALQTLATIGGGRDPWTLVLDETAAATARSEAGAARRLVATARAILGEPEGLGALALEVDALCREGKQREAMELLFARWREGALETSRALLLQLVALLKESAEMEKAAEVLSAELVRHPKDDALLEQLDSPELRSRCGEALADAAASAETPDRSQALRRAAALALCEDDETKEGACALWELNLDADPDDEEAFNALASLLAGAADPARWRSIQKKVIASSAGRELRLRAHWNLVELAEDPDEERAALEALVEFKPDDHDAARRLIRLLRNSKDFEAMAQAQARLAQSDRLDAEERISLLWTAGRAWAGPLEDRAKANPLLWRILELDPLHERALEELERNLRILEDHSGYADLLAHRIRHEPESDRMLEMLRELARIQEEVLEDRDAALRSLEEVISREPGNLPVLEEIARLHAEQGAWKEHLHALERMSSATGIRALRAEIYLRAADVLHQYLGNHERSLDLLAQASEVISFTAAQIEEARQVARAGALWRGWANLLRRFATTEQDRRQADLLWAELGNLWATELGDPRAGLALLGERFSEHPRLGPVLDAMEQIAETHEMREQLLPAYAALKEGARGNEEVLWRALHQSARIAEEVLRVPDRAFAVLVEAARISSARERAEAELERLATSHELWTQHAAYLESRWQDVDDVDESTNALLKKAEIEERQLGDWEAAFETLIAAFQSAPTNPRVREPLYRLADAHGQWELVLRLHEALQRSENDLQTRKLYLLQMADIYETRLDQLGDAFEQVLRAWESDHGDDALRARLADLAERTGRRQDLLRAYQWQCEAEQGRAERASALERTMTLADELAAGEAAVAACAELCVLQPESEVHRHELARLASSYDLHGPLLSAADRILASVELPSLRVTWLEQKYRSAEALGDGALQLATLESLVDAAPDDERWIEKRNQALLEAGRLDRLTETMRTSLSQAEHADEAREIGRKLADVLSTEAGASDEAVEVLTEVRRRFPEDAAVRNELLDFLEAMEMWELLTDELILAAREVPDPELGRAWRLRAAAVAEEYAALPERMLEAAEAQLEIAESDLEALEVRARALAMLERWDDHVSALHSLAMKLDGHASAVALVEAAMAAWRTTRDVGRAHALLGEASEAAPDAIEPAVASGDLFASQKRHEEAAEAYARALKLPGATTAPPREQAEILHRMALSLETLPNRLADAVEALERATSIDPGHVGARDDWRRLARGLVSLEDVEARLSDAIERAADASERERARIDRGVWRLTEGGNPAGAYEDLGSVDRDAPASAALLLLSADAALLAGALSDAMQRYDALLRSWSDAERPPESAPIVPGELGNEALQLLAGLRRAFALERAGDLSAAFEAWTDITLDHEGCGAAIGGQARIMDAQDNLPGAARFALDALETLEEGDSPPLAAQMHVILARNAGQDGRNDDELAELVLALDTGVQLESETVERAYELAAATRNPELSLRALHALADQRLNPDIRARVLLEIARHRLDGDPNDPGALRPISEALSVTGADERVLEQAAEMLMATADKAAAIALLEERLALQEPGSARARLSLALARLEQDAERPAEAASHFLRALQDAPQSASALRGLVTCRRAGAEQDTLAQELKAFLATLPDDATSIRAQVLRALGEVLLDDLDRVAEARPLFEELHRIFPTDVRVLEALLRIYEDDEEVDASESLRIAYELLQQGVLTESMLVSLERLHYTRDNVDGVLQVLQVRLLASVASDEERELLSTLPTEGSELREELIGEAFQERWIRPGNIEPAVIAHVRRAAGRVLEARPEGRPETLRPLPENSIIFESLPRLQAAFGLGSLEAFVHPSLDRGIRPLALSSPTLLVSEEAAAERDPSLVRFLLGRAIAMSAPEAVLLHALSPFEFMTFLEAALRPLVRGDGELDTGMQEQVDAWTQLIGDLEKPERFARAARHKLPSAGTWRDAWEAASVRAGLVAGFDSLAALRRLVDEHDATMPSSIEELGDLIARHADVRALVSYVLSDRFLGARRELGLVLQSRT